MQITLFTVGLLAATAWAVPEEKRQAAVTDNPIFNSLLNPPSKILSQIATAIPVSVLTGLTNPSAIQSLESAYAAGNPPDWFSNLPAEAQAYYQSLYKEASSLKGSLTAPLTAAATATETTETTSTTATSEATATAASSSNFAVAPTGAIGSAMMGVVGILGLAAVL